MLARAVRGDTPAARHRMRTFQVGVGGPQQRDPLGYRTANGSRSSVVRYSPRCGGDRRERHLARPCARRGLGTRKGLVNDGAERRHVDAIGRGEAPRAPVHDSEADAAITRSRDRFDLAIAHGDGLEFALDVPRVGVSRAPPRAELHEIRQLGVALGTAKITVAWPKATRQTDEGSRSCPITECGPVVLSGTLRINKTARATTNAFVRDALAYRPRLGITDLVSQGAFWDEGEH